MGGDERGAMIAAAPAQTVAQAFTQASTQTGASVESEPVKVSRDAVFHVHGVSKVYRLGEVEVHALKAVDIDLYRGEFVVILGPSGGGKSTLLNILGGLDVPTSGEVHFLDHNLTAASDRELTRFRREHVGFVFQFYNLIPSLTALENVQLVTEIAEHPLAADEALRLVGLGERMQHFPAQMSGGEQQRVAIARAVANNPRVLLADEPTGNLDPNTSGSVFQSLFALARDEGLAALIATHNMELARATDRVVALQEGRLVAA